MPDRRTWHVDRSINLPNALTIPAMLVSAAVYIMGQNNRQTATEGRVSSVEAHVKELKGDLRQDVQRVEQKVEKLGELIMADRGKR